MFNVIQNTRERVNSYTVRSTYTSFIVLPSPSTRTEWTTIFGVHSRFVEEAFNLEQTAGMYIVKHIQTWRSGRCGRAPVESVAHFDDHEHRQRQRSGLLALEDAAVELVELALLRQALRVVRLHAAGMVLVKYCMLFPVYSYECSL